MGKQALQGIAVAAGAAVVAFIYYGIVLDVTRGGVPGWQPVVEGVLTGVAVLVVWTFVRSRIAAANGLVVMAALVLIGTRAAVIPALGVAQAPMSWAVMLALAARLAAPTSVTVRGHDREHAV
jgi:hypothetical protein